MAQDKRKPRSAATTGGRGSGGSGPKGARPAREPSDKGREPSPPPGRTRADYLIPGLLGAGLIIAIVAFMKMSNRTPPEPAASSDSTQTAPAPSAPSPSNLEGQHAPPPPHVAEPPPPPPPVVPPSQATGPGAPVEPTHPRPDSPDPRQGHFTMADATAGLPAGNRLVADITTSMGVFHCDLFPDRAPTNVANFVGLARGLRDFWDPVAGRWTRRPFYDGSVFHRVIPDFMIQGGDILRSGRGDPGYEVPDENVANHDEPGLLCMANHGPNTGGAQFFIMEDPKPHLNGSYSVLGRCAPTTLVEQIARVPRDPHDRPLTPVMIQSIRVHR